MSANRSFHRSTSLSIALLSASLAGQMPQVSQASIDAALAVRTSQVLPVQKLGTAGAPLTVSLGVPGAPVVLQLAPHSVRAPGFAAFAQGEDGTLTALPAEPTRTYRGAVLGDPGSFVAGSWLSDGLYAHITMGNGQDYWMQPVSSAVDVATSNQHALYRSQDVLRGNHICASGEHLHVAQTAQLQGGGAQSSTAVTAELGVDADYEYFQRWGAGAQSRIESVVNTMNAQYQSEVAITHAISRLIVRTSRRDPYRSKNMSKMLSEVRSEWIGNNIGPRDVVQLFTGKNIRGGTIGIAYVGTVCNQSFGFGVVQSDFNNNFSCATDLSAHELGHNWNAPHCSCPSNTMNPFITCANTFSAASRNIIINYRNGQSCF